MTDLNPEIWENKTLGEAAGNENLDRLTKQQLEDRSAKLEGREPREVVIDNTHPGWAPEVADRTGTVPSNYQTVHFADEQQNDIPSGSGESDETAQQIAEEQHEENVSEESEAGEGFTDEIESPESNSAEENGSTEWK